MTAPDTPSRDELLALAERLETDVWGTKTRTAQRYLDDAADALRRLAANPADDGAMKAWMGKNDRRFDFDRIWRRQPPESTVAAYERAGWQIVPVEIRALSPKAKP